MLELLTYSKGVNLELRAESGLALSRPLLLKFDKYSPGDVKLVV